MEGQEKNIEDQEKNMEEKKMEEEELESDSDNDELETYEPSRIDFIPCLAWVRRGVAKPEPEKVQLSQEELKEIFKEAKGEIDDMNNDDDDESDDEAPEKSNDDKSNIVEKPHHLKTNKDIVEEYGLDDLDDGPGFEKLLGLESLAEYADPSEDPYIDLEAQDEEKEDLEDFMIRGTDNLILVGHVQGDDNCTLEVYVYNDEEDTLFVHHDILLPSFPLAFEWLSFDPDSETKGNLVAVGSMAPIIQVWDLDLVDCIEPAFTLGAKGSKAKKIKRVGHKDAVMSLAWNEEVGHVLASGSVDTTVKIWDLNQKNVNTTLKYHQDKVQSLGWHPFDCQTLATGCCDKYVRVADCRTQDSHKKWRLTGEIECVKWNHFNPYQVLASTDAGTVHCIDVRQESAVWTLAAHTQGVSSISLSSQCPGCLITVSEDQSMKVWDILNDKPECTMERQLSLGSLQGMAGCPDAPFVVAVGGDERGDNFKVMDIRESASVRQRFGSRKLANPLNFSSFGYETANEAEPAESMDAEAAVDGMQSMSLQHSKDTKKSSKEKPKSGGAVGKFKKKDNHKKKKPRF